MWTHSTTAPHRVVSRAKAFLMAGDGVANGRSAAALVIGLVAALRTLVVSCKNAS